MKIWLDDIRKMPKEYDTWCKSYNEFIKCITLNMDKITEISFDHDLGGSMTGYDAAKVIEQLSFKGKIKKIKWNVHSANPVGKRNIEMAMKSAETFWNERK